MCQKRLSTEIKETYYIPVPMKTGVPRMMHSDTPTILSDLP
jgi:hypothetical protein